MMHYTSDGGRIGDSGLHKPCGPEIRGTSLPSREQSISQFESRFV